MLWGTRREWPPLRRPTVALEYSYLIDRGRTGQSAPIIHSNTSYPAGLLDSYPPPAVVAIGTSAGRAQVRGGTAEPHHNQWLTCAWSLYVVRVSGHTLICGSTGPATNGTCWFQQHSRRLQSVMSRSIAPYVMSPREHHSPDAVMFRDTSRSLGSRGTAAALPPATLPVWRSS